MDATLGFVDPSSKAAGEIGFAYGKLRRAELQRNYWTFAIKKAALRAIDTDTMILAAALWVESTTYFVGSIVADEQGNLWESVIPDNLGFRPLISPAWVPYFGPVTADAYDSGISYEAGELVYTASGDGTNRVFKSLTGANSDDPATATAYSATAIYSKNQVVTYLTVAYMSLTDLNEGNTPSASPAAWNVNVTYSAAATVSGSDGVIYSSISGSNLAHDPVSDAGAHWTNTGALTPWSTVFVGGEGSVKWLQIGGAEFPNGVTLTTPNIVYPAGSSPSSQSGPRNLFKLPGNFLRKAPQDPKAGSFSVLGAPTNSAYDDWLIESGYIVSGFSELIILRFVADVQDVRLMHDMFCEKLGYRIALAVVQPLTQSAEKKREIAQEYQKFGTEAGLVDAIENGAVEPPLDDYIACRV